MIGGFERLVAFRYLRPKRREGFLSVITGFSLIGIALGVATLIIVLAVMNGFRQELMSKVVGLGGHLIVGAQGEGGLTDYEALAARIAEIPGVTEVVPVIEGQALLTQGQQAARGVAVFGVPPAALLERPAFTASLQRDVLLPFDGANVAIGQAMARSARIGLGGRLTLIAPEGDALARGTMPRQAGFGVALLFDVGVPEIDGNAVFMPLAAAQSFFELPDAVTGLDIHLADAGAIAAARAAIAPLLPEQATLTDWRMRNRSLFVALEVERTVMFVILGLVVLIAAFNIIVGLVMLVRDKRPDIGILRTMGASRRAILRVFVVTGATIGVAGTAIGFGLGVLVARNLDTLRGWIEGLAGGDSIRGELDFIAGVPAVIDWSEVAAIVVAALALSFLATLYPAWKAARLDPVTALRFG